MINIRDLCKRIGVKDYNSFTRRIRQSGLLESVDYVVYREGRKTHYYLTYTESALYWLSKSNKVKQFRGLSHVNVTSTIQLRSQSSNVVHDCELVDSSDLSTETRDPRFSNEDHSAHEQCIPILDAFSQSLLNHAVGTFGQIIVNRIEWQAERDARRHREITRRERESVQRQREVEQRQREVEHKNLLRTLSEICS